MGDLFAEKLFECLSPGYDTGCKFMLMPASSLSLCIGGNAATAVTLLHHVTVYWAGKA